MHAAIFNTLKSLFASALVCMAMTTAVFANANAITSRYEFKTVADAKRFSTLTNETRCIVCQFQNIADSNAPLADSIRGKIFELINAQKTDDEIKNYLVERYGEVILLKPRFNWASALLWLFPALALCLLALIFRAFYQDARRP